MKVEVLPVPLNGWISKSVRVLCCSPPWSFSGSASSADYLWSKPSNIIWLAAEILMSGMHSTWLNCACIGMHPMPSVMWYSSNLLEFVCLVLKGDSLLPASYLHWVPLLTQVWEEKSVCSFKCFWDENASFVGREIPIVAKLGHGTLYNKFIWKNWSKILWHIFVVDYISTNSKFDIESWALET